MPLHIQPTTNTYSHRIQPTQTIPFHIAGCSIADELFDSFENLLKVAERRGITYDRIVLENSGVAEPQNIRDQFNEAILTNQPLIKRIHLDSLITVVDSATFIKDYSSRAPLHARPELGEGGGLRPVVDLLVEQIECADYVVLNKCDMLDAPMVKSLVAIVSSLNPLATVIECEHGRVPVGDMLGKDATAVVARLNMEGHHRGAVAAAKCIEAEIQDDEDGHHGECKACKEEGHDHHHHDHHDHHHHDHHHAHTHNKKERQATTAAARFGILSFVYSRRRPFHPIRLKDLVLRWMPVSHNKSLDPGEEAAVGSSPIQTVLRSKGFMWISNSHSTAFYWSHAGQHFEIRDEGEWWAALPDEDWPESEAQKEAIKVDFEGEYGDRRQELVFIGANMDKNAIFEQLDGALLTDEEMEMYKQQFMVMDGKV